MYRHNHNLNHHQLYSRSSSNNNPNASSNSNNSRNSNNNNSGNRHTLSQDKYERFESWLRENGAQFELLELREYDCPTAVPSTSIHNNMGGSLDEEKKEGTLLDSTTTALSSTATALASAAVGSAAAAAAGLDNNDDSSSSEMRGVHARRHIPPNTVCMSVPRRCLITVEMGQATPIGQAILQSDLDLDAPKHIFLMIYLLWDRKINGVHSFFHPYYEILPPTLKNMPIFWSKEELSYLQGSYLLQQIADRNMAIQEDYQAICQIAPLQKICTLEEFKWARMCVCSRNFGLQMDGHRTSALVPHADMLNHYRPRETKWTFDEDRQAFTITSLQHIPAGAQVYDSYGQKCNHRFLLNYGFAVEDNRELDGFCPNEVPIELYVDPDDDLFQEKLEYWTRGETATTSSSTATSSSSSNFWPSSSPYTSQNHGSAEVAAAAIPVIKRVRVCVSNNENTRLLFSLLRVLACNREELHSITSSSSSSGNSGSSILMNTMDGSSGYVNNNNNNSVGRLGISLATDMSLSKQSNGSNNNNNTQQSNPNFTIHHTYDPTTATTSALMFHHHHQYYHRTCRDIRHPISIRNERAAMHLLLEIVHRHLQRYPTSLAQDDRDLQDLLHFPRFSNKRHAKIQVRGEKVVLHHYAEWARTSLNVLAVMEDELVEAFQLQQQQQDVQHPRGVLPSTGFRGHDDFEGEDDGVEVQLLSSPSPPSQSSPRVLTSSSIARGQLQQQQPKHLVVLDQQQYHSSHHHHPPQQQQYQYRVQQHDRFDQLIRQLEDDIDTVVHHTIVRYCADVLGSLRREEVKAMRRRQQEQEKVVAAQQNQRYGTAARINSRNSSSNSNSRPVSTSGGPGSIRSSSETTSYL